MTLKNDRGVVGHLNRIWERIKYCHDRFLRVKCKLTKHEPISSNQLRDLEWVKVTPDNSAVIEVYETKGWWGCYRLGIMQNGKIYYKFKQEDYKEATSDITVAKIVVQKDFHRRLQALYED